jgi:hypothetical protein
MRQRPTREDPMCDLCLHPPRTTTRIVRDVPLTEDEIVLREYDNAWQHNRHLETLRSQYVGFFLAFVTATVALVGTRVSGAYSNPRKAAELSLFIGSASLVTWFVSVSLRRWGVVIRHYDLVILNIRRLVLSPANETLVRIKPRSGLGIQQAAELTLLVAHLALLVSAGALLTRVISLDAQLRYLAPTLLAFVAVGVSTATGANWRAPQQARESLAAPNDRTMQKGG